jgi:hypothetical protein
MGKTGKKNPNVSANKQRKALRRELKFEKLRKKRKGYKSKRAYLRAIKFGKVTA